jgi:hypothetical protein
MVEDLRFASEAPARTTRVVSASAKGENRSSLNGISHGLVWAARWRQQPSKILPIAFLALISRNQEIIIAALTF